MSYSVNSKFVGDKYHNLRGVEVEEGTNGGARRGTLTAGCPSVFSAPVASTMMMMEILASRFLLLRQLL